MATERPTAIIAAMGEELAPLLARADVKQREKLDGCDLSWGKLGRAPVVIARTREGRSGATRGAEALLSRVAVERLLVIGVSGGLTEALKTGDLIIGHEILNGGRAVAAPDADWKAAALRIGGATAGTLVSTREILCTPSARAALRETVGAAVPAAADLETAAYARAAAKHEVPWLAVRAISDTADEELPVDFNQFLDDEGRIRRDQIMWYAMRHPAAVPGLRDMQRRVSLCADRLADFVDQLLNPTSEAE
jgi:adenosylhomocysteine nucleosidase